jgi:hypothetical protein
VCVCVYVSAILLLFSELRKVTISCSSVVPQLLNREAVSMNISLFMFLHVSDFVTCVPEPSA